MSYCRSAQDNKALWQKQCHNIDSKTLVSERVDTMDLELLRRTEYNQQYIAAMRPVFNRRALFTDTSAEYVIPEEPADRSILWYVWRAKMILTIMPT